MDAIILAAGLGTRLRPYTLTTPKPLLEVQKRPILDWTLGALPSAVQRVVVVVNYLAEQIETYLKGQKYFRDWTTVRQQVPRGTGDALRSCRNAVKADQFLVLNGDDLFGARDLEFLTQRPAGLLMHQVDEPEKFGIVFVNPDGTLQQLVEKPKLAAPQMANIGAYLFPRRALDIDLPLSPRGEYEITDAVSAIAATEPFYAIQASFWLPIGTVEAWQQAQSADLSAAHK